MIYGEIDNVSQDIYNSAPIDGIPRVVVIDHEPDTAAFRTLVRLGFGWAGRRARCRRTDQDVQRDHHGRHARAPRGGARTQARALWRDAPRRHGAAARRAYPDAPVMLRWSYLLRKPAENQYVQRINLQQAAEHGYVPLTLDPQTTARALQTRAELRHGLGLTEPETTREALGTHGFLVGDGCAFLPVGLDYDELASSCRPGGANRPRSAEPRPPHSSRLHRCLGRAGRPPRRQHRHWKGSPSSVSPAVEQILARLQSLGSPFERANWRHSASESRWSRGPRGIRGPPSSPWLRRRVARLAPTNGVSCSLLARL